MRIRWAEDFTRTYHASAGNGYAEDGWQIGTRKSKTISVTGRRGL
jgi:hypothetical protein